MVHNYRRLEAAPLILDGDVAAVGGSLLRLRGGGGLRTDLLLPGEGHEGVVRRSVPPVPAHVPGIVSQLLPSGVLGAAVSPGGGRL